MSDLPAVRASDADREHAVVRLREAAADGRLTLDEFTLRMHDAYAANTHAQLESLLADLPERAAAVPARRRRAISVMGNTVADLRHSAAGADIFVACVMGNLTVLVPRGAHVELDATAFMGNKQVIGGGAPTGDAPVVRVTGFVVMGNLAVRHA